MSKRISPAKLEVLTLNERVTYSGGVTGCVSDIHPSVTAKSFQVVFSANNCRLNIAAGCRFNALNLHFKSDNTTLTIGAGTKGNATLFANISGVGSRIEIGKNCLFANVKLRSSDSHDIFDRDSGELLNPAGHIMIEDSVWISEDSLILKGAIIRTGAVIRARSLVSGEIPAHSLAVGQPAKVIRQNIAWRETLSDPREVRVAAAAILSDELPAAFRPPIPLTLQHPAPMAAQRFSPLTGYWASLRGHLAPQTVEAGDALLEIFHADGPPNQQKTDFLRALLGGEHILPVKQGGLRFLQFTDIAIQLEEIFGKVQYEFRTKAERPFIIDAGGCYGLASYYFQRAYPGAEVLVFEPNPASAAILRENIVTLGMAGVTLEEAAVGALNGTVDFYAVPAMPMASGLLPRLKSRGYETELLRVQQLCLTDLIGSRQVDMLKLDIEGGEYDLIAAMDGRMDRIKNMFIELHFGDGLPRSNLPLLLDTLERNGFEYMLARAPGASSSPAHPLITSEHIWQASLNLWARPRGLHDATDLLDNAPA